MKSIHKQQSGIGFVPIIIAVVALGAVGGVGYVVYKNNQKDSKPSVSQPKVVIDSFEECAKEGNPIQESYPEVCVTKDGKRFINPAQQAPAPPTTP